MGTIRCPIIPRRLRSTESIASWFTRVAQANAFSPHELASRLLGTTIHSVTNRDLDQRSSCDLTNRLAEACGQLPVEASLASLSGWAARLSGSDGTGGAQLRWVLDRRSVTATQRLGAWTQACPICLSEDDDAFFRTSWRLAFITECPRHGVELIDRCWRCAAPLDFLAESQAARRDLRTNSLSYCPRCDANWALAPAEPSSAHLLSWQRRLIRSMADGWTVLSSNEIPLLLFMDGVFRLQRALRSRVAGRRMLINVASDLGVKAMTLDSGQPFEQLAATARRFALRVCDELLTEWPDQFIQQARRSGFKWSDLVEERSIELPYWLAKIGRTHLDRTWFRTSDEEEVAATAVLRRLRERPTQALIQEWLGRSVQAPCLQLKPLPLDAPRQAQLFPFSPSHDRMLIVRALARRIAQILRKYCLTRAWQGELPLDRVVSGRRVPKASGWSRDAKESEFSYNTSQRVSNEPPLGPPHPIPARRQRPRALFP